MELRPGQTKRWNETEVVILAVDTDPEALVWVYEVANPDQDHMVPRTELR